MQVDDHELLYVIERRIYPTSLFACIASAFVFFQLKQFKRLYERIRNDKYLVGQRLINFERSLSTTRSTLPPSVNSPEQRLL